MYHVFVDFEMTCWSRKEKGLGIKIQEIIEIGAVKLDREFRLVDKFQSYVKPKFSSELSKTCTNLTGIRYTDLENAPFLDEVLIKFEDWLGSDDIKFYSWGMDDKVQLERECYAKGFYSKLPALYRKWRDFQNIFSRVFNFSKRQTLMNAVNVVGLDFEGTAHSALDDAVNGARLLMLVKNRETCAQKRKLLFGVYNNKEPFTSTLGELFYNKLSAYMVAS